MERLQHQAVTAERHHHVGFLGRRVAVNPGQPGESPAGLRRIGCYEGNAIDVHGDSGALTDGHSSRIEAATLATPAKTIQFPCAPSSFVQLAGIPPIRRPGRMASPAAKCWRGRWKASL